MNIRSILIGCAFAVVGLQAQAAGLVNGGFETGDLTGYSSSGTVEVVTSANDPLGGPPAGVALGPTEGIYLARLTAGPDPDFYTILTQTFTVDVTSVVSGYAAFFAFDTSPYNDDAYVKIYDLTSEQLLFVSSVAAVENTGGVTPWTYFESGLLLSGVEYVFEAGVRNAGEPFPASFDSQLLVDGIAVTAAPTGAIPEPATWGMMILGFGMAGTVLRRAARPRIPV